MKQKPFFIYIDDIRSCPDVAYPSITCRDYKSAIETIDTLIRNGESVLISFDHDLGTKETGYDVAKYIVENQLPQEHIYWRVHSSNPVGSMNIRQLLSHYGYPRMAEWSWN